MLVRARLLDALEFVGFGCRHVALMSLINDWAQVYLLSSLTRINAYFGEPKLHLSAVCTAFRDGSLFVIFFVFDVLYTWVGVWRVHELSVSLVSWTVFSRLLPVGPCNVHVNSFQNLLNTRGQPWLLFFSWSSALPRSSFGRNCRRETRSPNE